LNKQSSQYPEIDAWSELTHNKISSVSIKILKDAGIYVDKKLTRVNLSPIFLKTFIAWGDPWFLQALLLNKEQRNEILNG